MRDLVAVALAGGDAYTDALRRLWDAGDAILPVDPRLPAPAREQLFEQMAPARVIEVDGSVHRLAGGRPIEDGDAAVVATSGSTGVPKGVVLSHDAVAASVHAVHAWLGIDPDRHVWLACLPLSHVGGLGVVARGIVSGTPVIVHDGFHAEAVEAAARDGATHAAMVPTVLARIDPTLFERLVVGGSTLPPVLPPNTVASYAMTETGSSIVYDGEPLEGVELRIDEGGQIHVRGPMLLRCYRDGTDPKDAEGWYPTGDLGELDGEGHLTVHGRQGDLIITGGENVWPTPIEEALTEHRAVAEVAVAGRPDPEWGERVVAYVVPAPGVEPPTLEGLRGLVKERLPAFMAPRELVLRDEALPRTSLGKIQRTRL